LAARFGDLKCLQFLIDGGVPVDIASGTFKRTSLFETAVHNHPLAMRLLLKNGASVATRDSTGWTALHAAATFDHMECATILLEHGADVFAERDCGATPVQWAALRSHTDMIRMLF
ncbi:ankyrin repeat-containing domain protein, partial [Baffinella frigidus]